MTKFLYKILTNLHMATSNVNVASFSQPHWYFILSVFNNYANLLNMTVNYCFKLHFPNYQQDWAFFHVYDHLDLLYEWECWNFSPILKIGWLVFSYWSEKISLYSLNINLLSTISVTLIFYLFCPVCGQSLHFHESIISLIYNTHMIL